MKNETGTENIETEKKKYKRNGGLLRSQETRDEKEEKKNYFEKKDRNGKYTVSGDQKGSGRTREAGWWKGGKREGKGGNRTKNTENKRSRWARVWGQKT